MWPSEQLPLRPGSSGGDLLACGRRCLLMFSSGTTKSRKKTSSFQVNKGEKGGGLIPGRGFSFRAFLFVAPEGRIKGASLSLANYHAAFCGSDHGALGRLRITWPEPRPIELPKRGGSLADPWPGSQRRHSHHYQDPGPGGRGGGDGERVS